MQRRNVLPLISFGLFWPKLSQANSTLAPALWLANTYRASVTLQDYWVSEKYDGIRGYWNGHQLLTRKGKAQPLPNGLSKTGLPRHLRASFGLDGVNSRLSPLSCNKNKPQMQPGKRCVSWCLMCLVTQALSQNA